MKKVLRIGRVADGDVFCKVDLTDGRLSITGVVGPMRNGNAKGSAGQIAGGFAHRDPADNDARYGNPIRPDQIEFAPRWDAEKWLTFLDVWKKWHLNDMRAGCEHQCAEGWDKRPIDPSKPTTAYGKHFPGQKSDSWNMLAWVSQNEHPEGLLSRPCPVCGHKYGTRWLRDDVPADVIAFLESLPDADIVPAWV